MRKGADANIGSPLFTACQRESVEIAAILIQNGASVNNPWIMGMFRNPMLFNTIVNNFRDPFDQTFFYQRDLNENNVVITMIENGML